jgi:RsiW-degrading membrane proteinase PrsW (M82 family)
MVDTTFLTVLGASILAAGLPTAFYVLLIWWLDRYEKEPLGLLGVAFLWGAVPGIVIALLAELVLKVPISTLPAAAANTLQIGLVAPVVEEVAKALALFGLFLAYRREFDDVLDGIVYGAVVGAGFAFSENVLYFVDGFYDSGAAGWGLVVFLRAVVFGLNHAFFTSITGAGLGLIRHAHSLLQRAGVPLLALVGAITFHGIHNFFALVNARFCGSLLISALSDWGGVAIIGVIAFLAARRERVWIVQELAEEVEGGTLSPQQYGIAASAWARWRAQMQALGKGRGSGRRTGQLYQLASELAFKKHALRTWGDEGGALAEITALRQCIVAMRAALGEMPPSSPPVAQPPPRRQVFCTQCGTRLVPGDRFCRQCGQGVRESGNQGSGNQASSWVLIS